MGFYIRKSIKAGPIRLNLSKSGVGASVGVKGLRVGTGPRGNYIHMGRGGVYYRATLGGGRSRTSARALPSMPLSRPRPTPDNPYIAPVQLDATTGTHAAALQPTGPGDLVEQINEAAGRIPAVAITIPVTVVLSILIAKASSSASGAVLFIGLALSAAAAWVDRGRRSVVAFYEVDDEVGQWFDLAWTSFASITSSHVLWRVSASGKVRTTRQYKTNAGASNILHRDKVKAGGKGARHLRTNIAVPSLEAGRSGLYFLPDRLLIRDGRRYSDVAYEALSLTTGSTRFIESGTVPRDSQQVDSTWQFVNVKGGPDRRYKNNRRLPIMLYGTLDFTSSTGLQWQLETSRAGAGHPFAEAVSHRPTVKLAT